MMKKSFAKNNDELTKFYRGKDILVTGGAGSIGQEIVRQLVQYNPLRIRVFDQNESALFYLQHELDDPDKVVRYLVGNIRDKERLKRSCKGVDIIFHASALKHVPSCEYNPYEAVYTNVIGTQNLIDAAKSEGVKKVIAISTDKAVHPISTMGATKLLSEKLILNADVGEGNTVFSCVRFGNVLDSVGSVVPIFKKQIAVGGPVTLTSSEMTRFFMSMKEAVHLVLKAGAMSEGREIFILKMKSMRVHDLAKALIEGVALGEDIKIEVTGIRPGEKLYELLMTDEEALISEELGEFFIIRPGRHVPHLIVSERRQNGLFLKNCDSRIAERLSKDEIKRVLEENGII